MTNANVVSGLHPNQLIARGEFSVSGAVMFCWRMSGCGGRCGGCEATAKVLGCRYVGEEREAT